MGTLANKCAYVLHYSQGRRRTFLDNSTIDIPSSFLRCNNFSLINAFDNFFKVDIFHNSPENGSRCNFEIEFIAFIERTLRFLFYMNGWSWDQMFGAQHPRGAKPQRGALIYAFVRAHRVYFAHTSRIRRCSMHHASRCSDARVEVNGERKGSGVHGDEGTKERVQGKIQSGGTLRRRALLPTVSSLSAYK